MKMGLATLLRLNFSEMTIFRPTKFSTLLFRNQGVYQFRKTPEPRKSPGFLKEGPENTEILLIIPEKFQNDTQYLFKQETMMIKNYCSSQNELAIVNIINKEERKLIF